MRPASPTRAAGQPSSWALAKRSAGSPRRRFDATTDHIAGTESGTASSSSQAFGTSSPPCLRRGSSGYGHEAMVACAGRRRQLPPQLAWLPGAKVPSAQHARPGVRNASRPGNDRAKPVDPLDQGHRDWAQRFGRGRPVSAMAPALCPALQRGGRPHVHSGRGNDLAILELLSAEARLLAQLRSDISPEADSGAVMVAFEEGSPAFPEKDSAPRPGQPPLRRRRRAHVAPSTVAGSTCAMWLSSGDGDDPVAWTRLRRTWPNTRSPGCRAWPPLLLRGQPPPAPIDEAPGGGVRHAYLSIHAVRRSRVRGVAVRSIRSVRTGTKGPGVRKSTVRDRHPLSDHASPGPERLQRARCADVTRRTRRSTHSGRR